MLHKHYLHGQNSIRAFLGNFSKVLTRRKRMISDTHKFIFIDITKTGGSSIGKIFKAYGGRGKHHSISRNLPDLPSNQGLISPLTNGMISDYFTFTIVRNPWDRFVSLYSYLQTAPLQQQFVEKGWEGITWPLSGKPLAGLTRETYWPTDFEIFVEWFLEYRSYFTDFTGEKYIPMVDWLKSSNGNIAIDCVAKFENLQSDFNYICDKIGIPLIDLPKVNESLRSYKIEAARAIKDNVEIRNRIFEYFKEDFHAFGYSERFEDSNASGLPFD